MRKRHGALPDHEIEELISAGVIGGAQAANVQSESLDLALSEEMYRVDGVFRPGRGETVRDALKRRRSVFRHDPRDPFEEGVTYCVRLEETFDFPPDSIYGYSNPKSSTGRHFITAQIIADGAQAFDSFPRDHAGNAWVLVTPDVFPIVFSPGDSVSQVRFFDRDTRFDRTDLSLEYHRNPLLYDENGPICLKENPSIIEGGRLVFTLGLQDEIVGYRARHASCPLIFSQKSSYDPEDYYEKIPRPASGEIVIRKGEYYLLRTRERIRVPPYLAAEVEALDSRSGNFFAHKAGYVGSGYGFGGEGEIDGLPITLELSAVDRNIVLRHGERICLVSFERLRTPTTRPYRGSYSEFRLLPKQFKKDGGS